MTIKFHESIMTSAIILQNIPTLTADEFNSLLSHLTPNKQERIKLFRFENDAHNCLLGDILVRFEICRIINNSNKHLKFSTNGYGKPFLVNYPHIHFNVT